MYSRPEYHRKESYATNLLADMGADVVKLEAPVGDQIRYYRPQRSRGLSGKF